MFHFNLLFTELGKNRIVSDGVKTSFMRIRDYQLRYVCEHNKKGADDGIIGSSLSIVV